ncbi:MAG: alpha/beta hydrolase domain-containing protein [Chloroflexi bacterium]|nr:alpha/beta hydrolase domain-containing protein [Chloroflexota bacterium]
MPVIEMEITKQFPYAGGESYGKVGPYQQIEGTLHYAVDPLNDANKAIVDLELAPRDADGNVRFSADFVMLQPEDLERGNGSLLYDVVNRGRKTVTNFNSSPRSFDPTAPIHPGNGFLMRQGYTVLFGGWQADVPPDPGLIGLRVPEGLDESGDPLVGRMLCQFQANEPSQLFLLADRTHLPHPPADAEDATATLTVQDHPNGPATPISRDQYSFVRVEDQMEDAEGDPHHIYMPSGFEPGRIYQLVYTTRGSAIVGLGFAAVRDTASFFKHGLKNGNGRDAILGAGSLQRAYAFGSSQCGRFLRQYIHTGVNTDEDGRMALDGIIAHIGGGMRGEFNMRFGQPSKDVCFIIPELFPFTDTEQTDPVTGETDSLLGRFQKQGQVPKIMFTNTSAEYWRGDAALIHTDLVTLKDAPEHSDSVRKYHFTGTQHGIGIFPPEDVRPNDGVRGQLPFNSVDYSPLQRAALQNLDRWVTDGEAPPPSRHPSLSEGTAVESKTLLDKLNTLPGVTAPNPPTRAKRLDFGPEKLLGRTTILPAIDGEEYPAFVSDINDDCNEIAGISLPDITVPLATYTGWNLRHSDIGNTGLVIGITGGLAGWTLPLGKTRRERRAAGDPRPSIEERYRSKDIYLEKVFDAAEQLVKEGYLLEEDVDWVMERSGIKYDFFMESAQPPGDH